MALTLQQVRTLPAFADMSDSDIISHASSNGFDTSAMIPDASNEGDIQRGFNNTFRQLPQIGYGLTAIAGATGEKVFGEGGISTGIKKAGLAGYQEASANMAEHSKPSDSLTYSWDRAKEGHFGDLADWVQHGIGYAGGQGLQLIATAGFGNLAAKEGAKAFAQNLTTKMVASEAAKIGAVDAAKVAANTGITAMTAEAIQQAAVKGVASKIGSIGANTAMGVMALGMEGGEIGGDLATKAQERGTPLTGTELAKGFGATIGAGALEFVGDKFGLDILTGKSKLYKALGSAPGLGGHVGRGVAAGAIAGIPEAATEYSQTLTEEYGKGNDPFSAEAKQQAFDAAGQGAIGGHVMGFAGGLLSAPKPKTPEQLKADQLKAEKIQADLSTTASTGTLGNALATGGFTNQGDSIHDINPDNTLDTRTYAQNLNPTATAPVTNSLETSPNEQPIAGGENTSPGIEYQSTGITNEQPTSINPAQEQSQSTSGPIDKVTPSSPVTFEATHELNDGTPVQQIGDNAFVDQAGDEWGADDARPLQANPVTNPTSIADANPLIQPETLNGGQESTSETQNANAQEKGLLGTVASEQSGATPNIEKIAEQLHSAISSDPSKTPSQHFSDIVTEHKLTQDQADDVIDSHWALQQNASNEQANQQTETQAQDQASADQSTGLDFQPTHTVEDGTPVVSHGIGEGFWRDERGNGIVSFDAKPIGNVDTSTDVTPSYATAPLLNKRTNKPFKTRKMAEVAIASSSNPTVNQQDHIAVPVDGGFGIAPKPNTTPVSNDTTTKTQPVLPNTGTNTAGVTASTPNDVAGQASNATAQEVVPKTKLKQVGLAITRAAKTEHRSIDGVGGAYHRSTNDSRRSDEIHSLTQTTDDNGNPDYTAHISINTPIDGASNGTKTNEGKYSLNALLNSGAISQQTHDFLVDEYHGKNNDVIEANNNHQLTADDYVSNNNAQFPNSKGINDSLRKSHYTDIRSHLDQGGKISKAVFDSLDGLRRTNLIKNYGEDIIDAEAINQPSKTQATEAVATAQEFGNLSNNDQAKIPQVAQPTLMKRNVELHTVNGTVVKGDRYLFPGNERHPIIITKPSGNKGAATKQNHVAWDEISGSAIYMEPSKVYKDKPSAQHVIDVVSNQFNSGFGNKLDGHESRIQIKAPAQETANPIHDTTDVSKKGENVDITHAGQRIYQKEYKEGSRFLVETNDNKERRLSGDRNRGGDSIFNTLDEAKNYAEEQKTRDDEKANNNKEQAEKDTIAQEQKVINDDTNGFADQLKPHIKALVIKRLNEKANIGGTVDTVKNHVKSLVAKGELPNTRQEDKVKEVSRTQFNRMNNEQQQAHALKIKEAGEKTIYSVGGYNLGKTAYEYAQHLVNEKKTGDTDYANQSSEQLRLRFEASQSIKEKDAISKILSNRRADEIANNLKPLEQKQQEQSNQLANDNLYKDIVKQKTYSFKQLYTLATKHNTTVNALVDNQDVSKFSVTKVKNEKNVAMFHVKDNATATENIDTAKPEWHIDIPEHGLAILPTELKGEGYRAVAGRIAKDAVEAITQNQKIANDTLYLYFLPAAENYNAIARYFPEDQKPGGSWQITDSQGVRAGSLTNDQLLYKTESILGNKPILGWEKTSSNAINVIGKGNSGDVTRIDNEVEKNATGNEAKVYELLNGVEGVAKGYERDGKIRLPFYEHIISIDTIPKDDRESLGSLVSKNKDRIISAVNSLTNIGYDYNDPLQFGMNKDQQFDLLDFSMAENNFPKEVRNNNLNRLSSFFKQFGAEKIGKAISHVANVLTEQKFQAQYPDMAYTTHEGIDYPALTERLGGKVATHAYYATNARYIQLKDTGIAQTELVNGIKVILSNHAISESDIKQWEMTSVVYGSITKQEKVAQTVKPTLGKYIQPKATASAEDQKRLANRGSRIATLSGLNEAVRKSNPDHAYSDSEIQSAADEKIDAGIDWLISKQQPTKKLTTKGTVVADKAESNIQDLGEKIGGARKDTSNKTGPTGVKKAVDDRPTWAKRFSITELTQVGGLVQADDGKWIIRDSKSKDWRGQARTLATFDTEQEAKDALPLLAVAIKHRVTTGSKDENGDYNYEIWRNINERKRVKVVDKSFKTREEAMQYMAQNAKAILETNTTFGESDLPVPENKQRTGKAHRDGDVNGESFMHTFGIRGVEFGNWNNQDERQEVMNAAYDGLMDLSEVLSIPPTAIGLNGELALAFGARGAGLSSAKAHYELQKSVINLTKMNGAGALAHEWLHALDHYLGRLDGKADANWVVAADGTRSFKITTAEDSFVSSGFKHNSGVREALRDAFKHVMETIFHKAETYISDTKQADNFVARTKEGLANELDRLRKDLSQQKDIQYYKRNNKPASAEQLIEFDTVASQLLNGDALETQFVLNEKQTRRLGMAGRQTNEQLDKLSAIYKAVRGRSGFDATNQNGVMDRIRQSMRLYDQRLQQLAFANSTEEKIKKVPTSFAMDAKELDQGRGGDYWTTAHEMAARAFQGYVEDKMAEQAGRNPFLNYAPANFKMVTPWGGKRVFPHGEERKAINAAFDKFVTLLKTKETEQGTAIYEPKKDYGISETGADNTNDAGWRNNALQRPQVINAKTSIIKTGLTEVNSPQDALHVISSFSNYAQEQMVALVLGANNKVLQIVRHTAGLNDSSMVDPGVLAGSIHGIKGAKSVYFAHNHPSGKANQSKADRDITDKLTELLRGTGINSKGMLVTVTGNEGTFYNSDEHFEDIDITETHAERTKNIPVTERHLISNTKIATESITGEDIAVRVANVIASGREGVLLLDNQNTPVSFVEITIDDMNRLRTNKTGTGASLLLKEIHETNARAMMMVVPKPNYALSTYADIAKNLGAFANNTGHTRMLDGIIGTQSLMANNYDFDRSTPYFSKSTTPVVNPHSKTTLNQAVTKAMDTLFGQGWTNRLMATGKFKMISAAEATGLIGKNAMFHKVWHGSPHDHNGFDSNHIDTGEGAQAFGWGHYFSDLKTIGEWYRDTLQNKQLRLLVDGKDVTSLLRRQWYETETTESRALGILLDELKYPNMWSKVDLSEDKIKSIIDETIIKQMPRLGANDPNHLKRLEKTRNYLSELKNKKLEIGKGKLYEVDLAPNQDEYLDWDKPLSQQSDVVKAGLKELHKQLEGDQLNEYLDRINADWIELTGEELYQQILQRSHQDGLFDHPDIYDRSVPDDEASSHLLHSLGIRGIRYKAESGQSEASNYVIFNDADIKIEVKYSKNGDVIAFYNPADDTTYLVHDNITQNTSAKALQGLMLHEIGVHALTLGKSNEVFKDILRRFEALKATNPKVQAAFDRVPKDTNAEDIVEEALAHYLSENPRSSLAQRIVEWFRQAVRALGKTLPVLERAKFSQWANKLTEAELIGMATSALKSAPDSLQFDNVGRNREGIKLSYDESVDAALDGKSKGALNLGETPLALVKSGIPKLPLMITEKVIDKAHFDHGLSAKFLKSLPDLLSNPLMVFKSDTQAGSFVVITHATQSNKPVMVAIKPSGEIENIKPVNIITSAYGKPSEVIINWIKKGLLLASDKKSALAFATTNGVRFPTVIQSINKSLAINLEQNNKIVNTNNIKFSRTHTITTNDYSAMRSFFAPAKGKQALGWLAGGFQRNHLIDFVAQDLPELINYKLLSQEKDNFTNQRENEIGKNYKELMDKMDAKTMHELGRVQGLATRLENFDPATANDNTPMTEEELAVYDTYTAMPEGAKEAYATMRKAYQDDLTEKKEALKERIRAFPADKETQAEIIRTIEEHFDQFKEGVYFPLNRDGAVIVKATNAEGELVIEHVATQADAYKLVKEMTAQGYDNTHIIGKDAYDRDLLAGNAANEMASLAHKTISDLKEKSVQGKLTESDFNDLFSEFNQLLINTLPDSSYRKHFIHRKGTLGESTDTLRAYSKTRVSAVKMIASLTYDHQIQDVLNNADKTIKAMDLVAGSDTLAIKSIVNELRLREAALKSTEINAVSQILTSLGFIGALGFNIGSAAVNMLQVVGVALPELIGRHGEVEAMKEIGSAYKLLFNPANLNWESGIDITKNPNLTAIAKQAMEHLARIGRIDLTMAHDSIAAGKNPSYSSNPATRAFGAAAKYSGYFFHVAEAVNRQVTGMAAFNLAYQKNGGDFKAAIADAVDVIDRTQFDYSQGNRARYMMSNTAKVLTMFKAFALGMSYFIGRNAYQSMKGETPEVRRQARKTLVASMAMSFATAGLFGMPIGIEAFAAIGGVAAFKYKGAKFAVPGAIGGMLIFQALLAGLGADDEDELETEFRNWLTDNFDQTTAEWVTKGPARLLPIGDIAGRTSSSELWWRSQNKQLEGTDQYNAIATALIGPIGSQVAGLFTAKKMYEDGQYSRMVESMAPAFLRNAIAANRMGSEGVTNLKGDKIIQRDLTPVELINKVIGFNPTVVTNAYDANSAIAKESTKHTLAKSHLVNRWISGDATERSDLMKGDIKDFNESVPPSERITLKSLFKSRRSRKGIDKHTKNGLYLSKKQNYLRDIGRFNRQE